MAGKCPSWHSTPAAVPNLGGNQPPNPYTTFGTLQLAARASGCPEHPRRVVFRAQTRAVQQLLQKLLDSLSPLTPSVVRNPPQRRGGSSRRAAGRASSAEGSEAGSELTRLAWARRDPESVLGAAVGDSGTWRSSPPTAAMARGKTVAKADTGVPRHWLALPDPANPAHGSARPHVGGARGPRVAAPPAPAAAPIPGPETSTGHGAGVPGPGGRSAWRPSRRGARRAMPHDTQPWSSC